MASANTLRWRHAQHIEGGYCDKSTVIERENDERENKRGTIDHQIFIRLKDFPSILIEMGGHSEILNLESPWIEFRRSVNLDHYEYSNKLQ